MMDLTVDSSTYTITLNSADYNLNYNDSVNYNGSIIGSDNHPNQETFSIAETIIIAFISGCFSIITIVGNVMVMISFKMDKQLQTISNYFLLSLSIADFLIGIISMPLFSLYTLLERWPLGPFICDTWLAIDYLISNASVLNLLIISFDRYFSVTRPLTYRAKRTTKKACIMIATTWIISLLMWPPWILSWPYIEGKRTVPKDQCYIQFLETNSYITFGTAIGAFYIPLFVMIVLYWRIWRETEKRYRDLTTLFLVSTVGASRATGGGGGGGFGGGNRSGGGGVVMLSRKNTSSSSEGQVITTTTTSNNSDKRSSSFDGKLTSRWWFCWSKSSSSSKSSNHHHHHQYSLDGDDDKSDEGSIVGGDESKVTSGNKLNAKVKHGLSDKRSSATNHSLNHRNRNVNRDHSGLSYSSKSKSTVNSNVKSNNNNNKNNRDDISPTPTSTGTCDAGDSLKGSESIYTIVIKLYGDEESNHTIKMIEHGDNNNLETNNNITNTKDGGGGGGGGKDKSSTIYGLNYHPHSRHSSSHHQLVQHSTSIEQGSTSSGSTIAKSPGTLSVSGSSVNPRRLTSNPSGTSIHPQQPKSERKAAKTLSAILLAFAITWTPYNVLVLINSLSGTSADEEKTVPKSLWDFCYYLCYINSTINPLCYALCNATFRRTYIRILKCKWSSKKNKQHRRQKHWNLE
ncbi:muscarinic acetylcholine receptor M5-like [Panonychus citri]|uniref:muscarinic acetylcholine receptor M5-like n=1 Tax=Panonychus citri TaxID=50023 RepID=UPI0023074D46|nr:muscarinic acetylcholine receptor M5-like [Panonychus citri]